MDVNGTRHNVCNFKQSLNATCIAKVLKTGSFLITIYLNVKLYIVMLKVIYIS